MENCKHADCCDLGRTWITWGKRGVINHNGWRLPLGDTPIAACPWCLARLEPPAPEVMTLEEALKVVKRYHTEATWCDTIPAVAEHAQALKVITAHLEGEPRGLEHNTAKADAWAIKQAYELLRQLGTATRAVYYDERAACIRVAGLLEPIAQRHTKGGKQA